MKSVFRWAKSTMLDLKSRRMIKLVSGCDNLKFIYLDVGAHGGMALKSNTRKLKRLAEFNEFISIGFEPEPSAVEELRESGEYDELYSVALWCEKSRRKLYVTKREALSSLFEPSENVILYSRKSEAYRVKKVVEVDCVTIDDLLGSCDVDLLKMNVQGASHEVLLGAENKLDEIIAIQLDLFFDEVYKGQKTFQETHDYLGTKGFKMVEVSCPPDNGILSQGIFTYFKNPDLLSECKLIKLLATAVALEKYEYARHLVSRFEEVFARCKYYEAIAKKL